jgi:hypothetical protein
LKSIKRGGHISTDYVFRRYWVSILSVTAQDDALAAGAHIVADPENPTHVYVEAEIGVWHSPDKGANWARFPTVFPRRQCLTSRFIRRNACCVPQLTVVGCTKSRCDPNLMHKLIPIAAHAYVDKVPRMYVDVTVSHLLLCTPSHMT